MTYRKLEGVPLGRRVLAAFALVVAVSAPAPALAESLATNATEPVTQEVKVPDTNTGTETPTVTGTTDSAKKVAPSGTEANDGETVVNGSMEKTTTSTETGKASETTKSTEPAAEPSEPAAKPSEPSTTGSTTTEPAAEAPQAKRMSVMSAAVEDAAPAALEPAAETTSYTISYQKWNKETQKYEDVTDEENDNPERAGNVGAVKTFVPAEAGEADEYSDSLIDPSQAYLTRYAGYFVDTDNSTLTITLGSDEKIGRAHV